MRVLFIRHGESTDDIDNKYGGWADFNLTPRGKEQIEDKLEAIKELDENFEKVLSFPLKRASQSAEIIAQELRVPLEIFEYVKERNTYGLLSGMTKADAKEKYPGQVKKLDEGKYVDGSIRHDDFVSRVKKSLELLQNMGLESVVVVTHGNYLKSLFEIFGKKLTKKEDGGFILLDLTGMEAKFLSSDGIEYE